MGVIGIGQETYLYVNGISTPNAITLRDSVALLPVETSFHYGKVSDMLKSDLDYAVAAISGRNIVRNLIQKAAALGCRVLTPPYLQFYACLLRKMEYNTVR